jgi:hypothetical protein
MLLSAVNALSPSKDRGAIEQTTNDHFAHPLITLGLPSPAYNNFPQFNQPTEYMHYTSITPDEANNYGEENDLHHNSPFRFKDDDHIAFPHFFDDNVDYDEKLDWFSHIFSRQNSNDQE